MLLKVVIFFLLISQISFAQTYIKGPALVEGVTSTASASGVTTLTNASQTVQTITGVLNQIVQLPDSTAIPVGRYFYVTNRSTGIVTVRNGAGTLLQSVASGNQAYFVLKTVSGTAGTWDTGYFLSIVDLGANVIGTLPVARGGTGTATAFTIGSVVFAGTSGVYTQDNANLFWDDTNNRLGIGTTSPTTPLHVINTTTNQSRIGYSTTQYLNTSIISTGVTTLNAVGSAPNISLATNGATQAVIDSLGHLTLGASGETPQLFLNPGPSAPGSYMSSGGFSATEDGYYEASGDGTIAAYSGSEDAYIYGGRYLTITASGDATFEGRMTVISNSAPQMVIAYDGPNGYQTVVNSAGLTTFNAYGVSTPAFDFLDNVGIGVTNPTALLHLKAGTTAASTAPLKFSSGALQTTAEAGAVEFLTDKLYSTITTGAARKEITLNDSALTSGRVPFATTNGRLNDDSDMTFATDTLTVTKIGATTLTGTVNMSALSASLPLQLDGSKNIISAIIPISGGGTNNASLGVTAGGVVYTDGSKLANTGAGTSGFALTSGGAGAPTWSSVLTNPMTTKGDVIYGETSGVPTRLAAGTSGFILQTLGTSLAPVWTALKSILGGATSNSTTAAMQIEGANVTSATPAVVTEAGASDWINGTCARSGTSDSIATCTFTTAFSATPVCVANISSTSFRIATINSISTTAVAVLTGTIVGTPQAEAFTLLCFGAR